VTRYGPLVGRVNRIAQDIGRAVDRAETLAARYRETGDEGYLDGVALNLHGFYTGVEQAFETIGREVDGGVPSGANWHHDLLVQMAADLEGQRPAVWVEPTRACLEEYRGVRHVVRNVYTFQFTPARIDDLCRSLRPCYERVRSDLTRFTEFLQALE